MAVRGAARVQPQDVDVRRPKRANPPVPTTYIDAAPPKVIDIHHSDDGNRLFRPDSPSYRRS